MWKRNGKLAALARFTHHRGRASKKLHAVSDIHKSQALTYFFQVKTRPVVLYFKNDHIFYDGQFDGYFPGACMFYNIVQLFLYNPENSELLVVGQQVIIKINKPESDLQQLCNRMDSTSSSMDSTRPRSFKV